MKSLEKIDGKIMTLVRRIPWIGQPLWNLYDQKPWFRHLVKFILSATVIYWLVRAPILWVLTELAHIHYLVSAFIAGVVVSLATFVASELWVWRERARETEA